MANQSKVTRDVRSAISKKSRFGGRNPISEIVAITGHTSQEGKRQVVQAIEHLKREGEVVVDKQEGRITGVQKRAVKIPPRMDRFEKSPQAKRESMYARGVPAYLTDDMVTPVVVTHAASLGEPEESVSAETVADISAAVASLEAAQPAYVQGEPYFVTLTKCLVLLRTKADENGYGHEISVRRALVDGMTDMTDSRATRAMDHLQGMGLYESTMTGFQKSSYQVDLHVDEVTAEMVRTFRRGAIVMSSPNEPVVAKSDPESQVEEISADDTDVTDDAETMTPRERDMLSQLADIVEAQDRELARLHSLTDTVAVQSEQITSLKQNLATQETEIRERLVSESTAVARVAQAELGEMTAERDRLRGQLDEVNEQRDRISGELAAEKRRSASLAFDNEGLKSELDSERRKASLPTPMKARLDGILARHTR